MKQFLLASLLSAVVFFNSGLIQAQTNGLPPQQSNSSQIMLSAVAEPGSPVVGTSYSVTDRLNFVVGYRLWLNYWQTTIAKVPSVIPDPHGDPSAVVTITDVGDAPNINQFAAASIPSVAVRYGNFFGSASVMISPDYHFPTKKGQLVSGRTTDPINDAIFGVHNFSVDHKVTGSRNEVDVNLGYYIHPWIALTLGYKGVFQKLKDKSTSTNLTHASPVRTTTETTHPQYNGGTIGIATTIPIPEGGWIPTGFSLYGNGGGGPMGSNEFSYAWYGTIDAGLAYKPTNLPLLFTGGYKFQIINSKTHSGASENHIIDYTRGAILGISYVF